MADKNTYGSICFGIIFFLVFLFPLFSSASAAVDAPPAAETVTGQSTGEKGAASEVRISSFASREEAEKFVKEIRSSGYEAEIRSERTPDNRTVYGVFVRFHGEQPKESFQLPVTGETGKETTGEAPAGTGKSFSDVLGGRSFFHASLAITELYTDNAFISNQNKKSGSSTVLSPEVWLLLPSTERRLPQLEDISAITPGGLILSRMNPEDSRRPEGSRRYEAFFLYHADIPLYSNLPSEKTVSHRAAAGFLFNGNRVFASITDQFERSYDVIGTGASADPVRVDKYKGNLLDASVSYDTRNRIRLMLDYSNFLLRYDDPSNDFQDRMDNSVAGYVFYQIQPKVALFVEYDFIDISHDNDSLLDSTEHLFFGGVQWDVTAKSQGIVKAGYGIKDFTHTGTNSNNYIFEVQVLHHFSSRNSLTLDAYRQTDETDYLQTTYILRDAVNAQFAHRLTERFTGYAGLGYARETYEGGDFTLDGVTQQRKDNVYEGTLSLSYQFKKWLQSDIGYEFMRRDSNFSGFSYTGNTIFFRVRGEI